MAKNITANETSLSYFLGENKGLYIPSYQRNYAWTKENAVQLFNDIVESFIENKDKDYYMGNLIVKERKVDLKNKFEVIDGQQRITTFLLFTSALNKYILDENILDLINKPEDNEIIRKIEKLVFFMPEYGQKDIQLKIEANTRNNALNKILNNSFKKDWNVENISEDIKLTNYYKNFIIFYEMFKEKNKNFNSGREISGFINYFDNVKFVKIEIDGLDVHKIFENINSTGVSLNISDLVKNFLYIMVEKYFKKSEDEKFKQNLEEEIENIFEENIEYLFKSDKEKETFFKNYIVYKIGKNTKVSTKILYAEITKIFKDQIKNSENKKEEIHNIIIELKRNVILWKFITEFEPKNSISDFEFSFFLIKNKIQGTVFPIIFLYSIKNNLFIDDKNNEIDYKNDKFKKLIILLEKYFSRKIILKQSIKAANQFFPEIVSKLREKEDFSLGFIKNNLFVNTKSLKEINSMRVIDDINIIVNNVFESSYRNGGEDTKHILFKLNRIMKGESNELIDLDENKYKKYNVEHIMPQSSLTNDYWREKLEEYKNKNIEFESLEQVHDKFIDYWGNITLVNEKDNSFLGNKNFENKKNLLQKSSFVINNFVHHKNDWGIKDIIDRQEYIKKIFRENF